MWNACEAYFKYILMLKMRCETYANTIRDVFKTHS